MYRDDEDPPAFEWDPRKAASNEARHGVPFDEAAAAFQDCRALVRDDPEHSVEEHRFVLLGVSPRQRLLVVSDCLRNEEATIRIISARRATSTERAKYNERSL